MDVVSIGEDRLRVADVVAVAAGAGVTVTDAAWDRIRSARAVVDAALTTGAPIYGLTTGVGHLKDTRLPDDELVAAQRMLLITHAGGIGERAPDEVVRAAMFVRLAGLARGGAGASPAVAETLAAMINAGVHPVVPQDGSVGAGDLGQMAGIGLVAIGLGAATSRGQEIAGAEALRRAGLEPLTLAPKDGLALMSSNGISVGLGALVVDRAVGLAAVADLAAAVSLEAVRGNPSTTAPAVAAVKDHDGQRASAMRIRAALTGGALLEPGAARSVQDALSFRVAPQVNGALLDYITATARAVEAELNSSSDNPLVVTGTGEMVHNGNFHPIVMAVAFDALRVAIAHVGKLSERRMSHLWAEFFNRVATSEPPKRPLFGLSLRYPAATLVAELRQLAEPATLDIPPLDLDVEDHSTGAPTTVARTGRALDVLAGILGIELLLAGDVLSVSEPQRLGDGTAAALAAIAAAVTGAEHRSPAEIHALVVDAVLPGLIRNLSPESS